MMAKFQQERNFTMIKYLKTMSLQMMHPWLPQNNTYQANVEANMAVPHHLAKKAGASFEKCGVAKKDQL
jgi:hypothetical protein